MDLEYSSIAPNMKISYDILRIIDDFILICFFIGNDFLPRIFCFDILQGTLEDLIKLFKQHLQDAHDYINNRGAINWLEFARLMKRLKDFEILALDNREQEILNFLSKDQQPGEYDDNALKI